MIHIAFCLDEKYVEHCATTIASILSNMTDKQIVFHVISDSINKDKKIIFSRWVSDEYGASIRFHDVDSDLFKHFPIENAYINISTYYRLMLPEILKDIDKVLYLDCDIIVSSSIQSLWEIDINNYAVAGIRDRINDNIRLYNRLRYALSDGYINAGVLLINLKKWREEEVFERALNISEKDPAILKNHDQDIINILFHDSKKILPFKYNLLEYYLYTEEWLHLDRKYYPEMNNGRVLTGFYYFWIVLPVNLFTVRNLFSDTKQSIMLRCVGFIKNTISLRNVLDQCLRKSGTL